MTTEITSQLPPCPLPDCRGGEHHFHDVEAYAAEKDKTHDCATHARDGFRCYGPHRPGLSEPVDLPEITDEMVERATKTYVGASGYADPCMRTVLDEFRAELVAGVTRWEPIEPDQIKAGMRIRATVQQGDCTSIFVGVARHPAGSGRWYTDERRMLTGWSSPTTHEVDPTTIPTIPADPDAELIAGVTRWQPIEHDQIRPGMRVKRTHKGVQMTLTVATRDATAVGTAEGWFLPLTSGTWQVDPSTIPDPDAELIEKIGKAIYDADEWDEDPSAETYRKLARVALDAVRESGVTA